MNSNRRSLPDLRPLAVAALVCGLNPAPLHAAGPTLSETPYVQTTSKLPGSFLDVVDFDIPASAQLAGSGLSFEMPAGAAYLLHISGLSLSLYDEAGLSFGAWRGSPASFAAPLAAGSYRVEVRGVADGLAGGAYTLGLAIAPETVVAAIPEPETWLLMIGGLALLGLRARRKA